MRFYSMSAVLRPPSRLIWPVFLLFTFSIVAAAQDLKGSWVGWIETDDFIGALRLDIRDAAPSVTLFYAGDKRSGSLDALSVQGTSVTFDGKMQPAAKFRGMLAGDRISGDLDIVSRNGTVAGKGTWSVRRVDPAYTPATPKALIGLQETGLPEPSGKFPIGRRLFFWTDESRLETITDDPADHRRVFVQFWYPANKRSSTPAEYFPAGVIPEATSQSGSRRITHAMADAPMAVAPKRFPVIVFSPGLGTSSLVYDSIIEDITSHGYVVAAINHPYDSGPVIWPDHSVIQQDKKWDTPTWSADERKKFFDERRLGWVADASFVVDQLKKLDIAPRLDFERLGMLGHSYGGQAASLICASDPRFKACANLDGLAQGNAVLTDASGRTMTQPFLFFTKVSEVTDAELEMTGLTRDEYRAREKKRLAERWKPSFRNQIASISSGGYLIVYPGITHMTFSDGPLFDEHSAKPFSERSKTARVISSHIRAFFDKALLGKDLTLLRPGATLDGLWIEVLKK